MTRDARRGGDTTLTAQLDESSRSRGLLLRVITGQGVQTHALPGLGSLVIGRGDDADLVVADPSVSRRHLLVHLGDEVEVEDLGSRHGTRVSGRRIGAGERARVAPGEAIDLGAVVMILQRRPNTAVAEGGHAAAIVADPAMIELRELIDRFAAGNISVLLLGETGVGKEVTAELVHKRSRRAKRPMLRLNCAALSETLLESELFGHERGAFTGAVQTKQGLLETAEGGTVFLDEVGELPMTLQVKLLRVLEERRITRVGGLKPIAFDVRFISATNRDLAAECAAKRFREDLFFRLDGARIHIPPLRERPAELEPLARTFVAEFAAQAGFAVPSLAPAALELLRGHRWPGNVRELRNLIERAVLLSRGEVISLAHFPVERMTPARSEPPREGPAEGLWTDLQARERDRILAVLEQCGGNQTRAAKQLGISRGTLSTRLAEYGVPRPRKPAGRR